MHSSALPVVFAQPQYALGAEYTCGHVGGASGMQAGGNEQEPAPALLWSWRHALGGKKELAHSAEGQSYVVYNL